MIILVVVLLIVLCVKFVIRGNMVNNLWNDDFFIIWLDEEDCCNF